MKPNVTNIRTPPRRLPIRSGAGPVIIQLATTVRRPGSSPTTVIRMEIIPLPDPNEPHTVSVVDSSSVALAGARVVLRFRAVGSGAWASSPAQFTGADGKTTFSAIAGAPGLNELEFTASLGSVSATKTIKVVI